MRPRTLLIMMLFVLCNVCYAQSEKAGITFSQKDNPYYKAIYKEYYRTLKHYHLYYNICHLPWRFFMFDLTDTTNVLTEESDTLSIVDNHIYYIVTPSLSEKVSIVMVPINEMLYFFSGLNCCKPIHRISDIEHWLSLQDFSMNETLMYRVRNCLSYYNSIPTCPMGSVPSCECGCKNTLIDKQHKYKKPREKIIKIR